jgi:hypothetical protein
LRATELTTGNSVTAVFTIVQSTNGSAILSITPTTATISGANTATCSAGFRADYYIYGGTPPYNVSSTFPTAVTLQNAVVTTSGGFFSAITNGTCVNPLVFTIVDSTGRQTTATLINQPGTAAPPTPPTPTSLVITPTSLTGTSCTGKTFQFLITGGTTPYSTAGAVITPLIPPQTTPAVSVSGTTLTVTGIIGGTATVTSVVVVDQSSPQKSITGTIT